MKTTSSIFLLLAGSLLLSCSGGKEKQLNREEEIKNKVDSLLSKMTVEEKVGQMTQVTLAVVTKDGWNTEDGTVDQAKLENAVLKYHVGSILNSTNYAMSQQDWYNLMQKIQETAMRTPNKIPVLYGVDAIHGTTYTKNSTLFPHNIGLAATRNDSIVFAGTKICALETRASAIRWNFDPVLDVGRNPMWSRFLETFGEDPYIVSRMGATKFKAYQGEDVSKSTQVVACMKHYLGYSNPVSGKDRTPAYIPEIQLREIYLPPFKAAVEAGALTVMVNSGEINGVPVHANSYLLNDVLRKELGFTGVAVTDWEDVIRLHRRHQIAATPKEAVRIAVMSGIDMSMVPMDFSFADYLLELVKEGSVPMSRIDEAVGRILTLKFKLGLFDNPYGEKDIMANFGKAEYEMVAWNAAVESITLLKNDSLSGKTILPLSKDKKVLLCGPGANSLSMLNGCWSYSWQGTEQSKYPEFYNTIAKAFAAEIGEKNVININDPYYKKGEAYSIAQMKAKASSVDYIILCLGEDAYTEGLGNITDLHLEKNQEELAKAAIATGKPVILVLTEGRPRIIREIVPGCKAVVQTYIPGRKGGEALADIIFGDANPSGKLPYSYPMYSNLLITYDLKYSEVEEDNGAGGFVDGGYLVQYPFGAGLSYTTFNYNSVTLSSDTLRGNEKIKVNIEVANTGDREGKESVELYSRDLVASITPSYRRLRNYEKISLKPGEKKTVTFELSAADLAFVNNELKTVTEEGEFHIVVGTHIKKLYYKP